MLSNLLWKQKLNCPLNLDKELAKMIMRRALECLKRYRWKYKPKNSNWKLETCAYWFWIPTFYNLRLDKSNHRSLIYHQNGKYFAHFFKFWTQFLTTLHSLFVGPFTYSCIVSWVVFTEHCSGKAKFNSLSITLHYIGHQGHLVPPKIGGAYMYVQTRVR